MNSLPADYTTRLVLQTQTTIKTCVLRIMCINISVTAVQLCIRDLEKICWHLCNTLTGAVCTICLKHIAKVSNYDISCVYKHWYITCTCIFLFTRKTRFFFSVFDST